MARVRTTNFWRIACLREPCRVGCAHYLATVSYERWWAQPTYRCHTGTTDEPP